MVLPLVFFSMAEGISIIPLVIQRAAEDAQCHVLKVKWFTSPLLP